MKNYLDNNGYPGTIQSDGSYDGGDTAAIIGTVKALAPMLAAVTMPKTPLSENGIPLRHPDITKWYGQPDRFSRDQLIATLCGILGDGVLTIPNYAIYWQHRKKWFLTAWNTKRNGEMEVPDKFPDICGPEVWALWIRILHPWWAALVLNILDLQTLVGAIQWRWFTSKTNRVTRNHMLVCIMSRQILPSLVMKLAYWINDWDDLVSRWENHCEAVGEYPTADLFKRKLK